jgi:hypothetical protein
MNAEDEQMITIRRVLGKLLIALRMRNGWARIEPDAKGLGAESLRYAA